MISLPHIHVRYAGQKASIAIEDGRLLGHANYTLHLEFENGEKRIFDMSPYMEKKPFLRLKGPLFTKAFIDYGTVCWPGEIDIAPETLYDRSVPIAEPSEAVAA